MYLKETNNINIDFTTPEWSQILATARKSKNHRPLYKARWFGCRPSNDRKPLPIMGPKAMELRRILHEVVAAEQIVDAMSAGRLIPYSTRNMKRYRFTGPTDVTLIDGKRTIVTLPDGRLDVDVFQAALKAIKRAVVELQRVGMFWLMVTSHRNAFIDPQYRSDLSILFEYILADMNWPCSHRIGSIDIVQLPKVDL